MTATNDILSKALSILKGHDFNWMMDDYAYTNGAKNRAKANMKYFVETIKQLPADLYELMKSLWMAEYHYYSGYSSDKAPQYKEEKEKLYAEVEAHLQPQQMVA